MRRSQASGCGSWGFRERPDAVSARGAGFLSATAAAILLILIGAATAYGRATVSVSGAPVVGTISHFTVSGGTSAGIGVWEAFIYNPSVVSSCPATIGEAPSGEYSTGVIELQRGERIFTSGFNRLFFQPEPILVCAYAEDSSDNTIATASLRVDVAPAPPGTSCNPAAGTCTTTTISTTSSTTEGVTTTTTVTCVREIDSSGGGSSHCSTQTTSNAITFTAAAAAGIFREQIMAEHPEATFPADEGTLCPELYSAGNGSYSICYAEYKIGGTWHLDGATATVKQNAITLSLIARTRWRRRWVKCNLRLWHVPGTLVSNNNCGLHQPQVDAYFIWNEAYPGIRSHLAVHHVGWLFADSAGFNSIGRYHAHKIGRVYTFTNAVGDSFRYTP